MNEGNTHYDRVGGAVVVRAIVDRFYDLMDTEAHARDLRALHPPELTESRDKLYEFLSGWLGGPPLYVEKRGHPRLRARHMPFAIDKAGRDAWMRCMVQALEENVADAELRTKLIDALHALADHMRNVDNHS